MRGRVDTASADYFERDRLRLMVERDDLDGRTLIYAERVERDDGLGEVRWPGWWDPHKRPEYGGIPEGASPFVLDCQRDVAYAVYRALAEHFEDETPVPTAGDRAYSDARTDITRLHELLDSTIGALIDRPHVISVPAGDPYVTPQRKDYP